jgi:hypothetical protein
MMGNDDHVFAAEIGRELDVAPLPRLSGGTNTLVLWESLLWKSSIDREVGHSWSDFWFLLSSFQYLIVLGEDTDQLSKAIKLAVTDVCFDAVVLQRMLVHLTGFADHKQTIESIADGLSTALLSLLQNTQPAKYDSYSHMFWKILSLFIAAQQLSPDQDGVLERDIAVLKLLLDTSISSGPSTLFLNPRYLDWADRVIQRLSQSSLGKPPIGDILQAWLSFLCSTIQRRKGTDTVMILRLLKQAYRQRGQSPSMQGQVLRTIVPLLQSHSAPLRESAFQLLDTIPLGSFDEGSHLMSSCAQVGKNICSTVGGTHQVSQVFLCRVNLTPLSSPLAPHSHLLSVKFCLRSSRTTSRSSLTCCLLAA